MHYEQYYQVATEQQYLDNGVLIEELSTCRRLKQSASVYNGVRNIDSDLEQLAIDYGVDVTPIKNFEVKTKMIIRHLEFSNGYMQRMWIKALITQDFSMIPFKIEELNTILANEPFEEV